MAPIDELNVIERRNEKFASYLNILLQSVQHNASTCDTDIIRKGMFEQREGKNIEINQSRGGKFRG